MNDTVGEGDLYKTINELLERGERTKRESSSKKEVKYGRRNYKGCRT